MQWSFNVSPSCGAESSLINQNTSVELRSTGYKDLETNLAWKHSDSAKFQLVVEGYVTVGDQLLQFAQDCPGYLGWLATQKDTVKSVSMTYSIMTIVNNTGVYVWKLIRL